MLENEQQEREEKKKQISHAVHPGSLEGFPGFRYFENTRWLGSFWPAVNVRWNRHQDSISIPIPSLFLGRILHLHPRVLGTFQAIQLCQPL